MVKARVLASFLLILSCLLMACGGSEPTPVPTPVEWYNLDQATGLSVLKSYRARYAFRWEGIRDGQQKTLSWDVLEEFVREPLARRILWSEEGTGQEGSAGQVEYIQIGKDAYMKAGSAWMAVPTGDTDIFKGNTFLNAPLSIVAGSQARLVQKNVTINSVTANRYAFDETTLGAPSLGAVTKAKGDVWVSTDFGVIVKYEAHYEGKNLAIGGGDQGVLDGAFDLMDINTLITIQAPQGVKPAMPEDIPILEDAAALTAVSGLVSYKSARTAGEVTAFYEAQMPVNGWAKGEEATSGMMVFTKSDRTAQIMIQAAEGKTSVMVVTSFEPD